MKKFLLLFSLFFLTFPMKAWKVWCSSTSSEVFVYTWNSTETVGESWPGTKMTQIGENLWYFEGEGNPTGIIFNVGSNMSQTADLSFIDGAIYGFNNKGIKSVDIPNSVASIGDYAFRNCSSLSSVVIPNKVTSVGTSAFEGCSSLTSVEIPNSVTKIGEYAFSNCSSLTSVKIGEGVKSIGEKIFYNCPIETAIVNCRSIPKSLFNNVTSLKDLTLGNSVTEIGVSAFSNCSSLTSVEIPNSVTEIGGSAFYKCSSLTSVKIGEGVESIGEKIFYNCPIETAILNFSSIPREFLEGKSSLKYLTLGNSVTQIEDKAFDGCSAIELLKVYWDQPVNITRSCFDSRIYSNANLIIPENTWIPYTMSSGWNLFKNVTDSDRNIREYSDNTYHYMYLPDSGNAIVMPNSSYSSLTSISIPQRVPIDGNFYSVYGISADSFEKCTNAKGDLVIPNGCQIIGANAFNGCKSLNSVTIPPSITEIGSLAFKNCSGLSTVNISDLSAWCNVDIIDYLESNPLYYAKYLFLNGDKIIDLVIPDDVKEIKSSVFYNGAYIRSINIPSTVISIGGSAFGGTGISSITIPSSLQNMGGNAFRDCQYLKTITFNQSQDALNVSGNLLSNTSVETLNLGRSIDLKDGYTCGFNTLKNLNLGGEITFIDNSLFKDNKDLKEIVIPSSVEYIGESAFENCGLTSIAIGAGIEEIGANAFAGNSPSTVAVTAIESPIAANTAFSYINGNLMVTPGCEEDYYNNPNCWYQFNYPTPLVVATGVKVTSEENGEGNVKLLGSVEPADASLPYVIWKSTDVNSGVIDPDGSVHFYNGAKECKFVATTLYADGPVVTVTIENNGNITSVEGGDTGVDSIEADFTGVYNVYSPQGFRVMTTNNADELGTLSKGIYIINGKKVLIGK